jgi:hypothetical protein
VTDTGHLLPDREWAEVVRRAAREAERIAAGPRRVAGRYGTGSLQLDGQVVAARHGGARPGAPTFGVLHDAETPLAAGFAASIAHMFATTTQDKSCHYMTDPAETWGVLDDLLVAWHCGNGNPRSIGLEQAGYARFTEAQWTVPDGLAQMDRNADVMRACRARFGIGLFWMTDEQLRAAHAGRPGGWATHAQCSRVLGGSTHTDPLPAFPLDLQMQKALDGADPAPLLEGDDVPRMVKPAGKAGPVYLVTDLDVTPTNDDRLMTAWSQVTGQKVTDLNQQQINLLIADASARRARLGLDRLPATSTAVAQLVGTDADKNGQDRLGDLWAAVGRLQQTLDGMRG